MPYRMEAWANAGAQNGIEYRYPLLDKRLLSFALHLPARLYVQQGWQRFLLRYTMNSLLPKEICWHQSKQDPARSKAHTDAMLIGLRKFTERANLKLSQHYTPIDAQTLRLAHILRQYFLIMAESKVEN